MKGSEEANQYFKYVTNDLFLTNENLESEYSNLKVQIDKMAQAYAVLESNYKDLSGENEQLRAENERVMRGGLTTPIPTAMQYGVESYPPYYSRKSMLPSLHSAPRKQPLIMSQYSNGGL